MEEQKDQKSIIQEIFEADADKMKDKPWYVRHGPTLLIVGLTLLGWIFCATWSHFFPNGIF